MKRNDRIVIFFFVLSVLFLSLTINAEGLVEKKDMRTLTDESTSIVIGKIQYQRSYWENARIYTDVTVSVSNYLKGKKKNIITLKIPGGTVGGISAAVSDVPSFETGEDVLLFLKNNDTEITGWFQGKYTIKNNKSEPSLLSGDQPDINNITPNSGPAKAAALSVDLSSSIPAPDSTLVTINGKNLSSIQGYVKFWRIGATYMNAGIVSWSDDQIIARVPAGSSSYYMPDGNGNVYAVAGYGASSNTANFQVTYSYGGGRWRGNNTTYYVNPNTMDTSGELEAIHAAVDTWNNAGANFKFIYGGLSSRTGRGYDGENSIMWVNYNTGSIATTWTYWYTSDPTVIIENDIEFNDYNYEWSTGSSPPIYQMDVQTIATHEFGHWLHLLDLYGTSDNAKMMYGYGNSGVLKRSLHDDDIDGIRAIYGRIERLCGDINCDGNVSIADVTDLLYYVGYPGQYDICNELAADVNGDGVIDISDVTDLLFYVGYPGQYGLICG